LLANFQQYPFVYDFDNLDKTKQLYKTLLHLEEQLLKKLMFQNTGIR
jgi:hypothetical protein